jgi:hypothetical protein
MVEKPVMVDTEQTVEFAIPVASVMTVAATLAVVLLGVSSHIAIALLRWGQSSSTA